MSPLTSVTRNQDSSEETDTAPSCPEGPADDDPSASEAPALAEAPVERLSRSGAELAYPLPVQDSSIILSIAKAAAAASITIPRAAGEDAFVFGWSIAVRLFLFIGDSFRKGFVPGGEDTAGRPGMIAGTLETQGYSPVLLPLSDAPAEPVSAFSASEAFFLTASTSSSLALFISPRCLVCTRSLENAKRGSVTFA